MALYSYARSRIESRNLQADFSESLAVRSLKRSFVHWFNHFSISQSMRQTEVCLADAREVRLMQKAFQAFKFYTT
jgi:hypothetical protein